MLARVALVALIRFTPKAKRNRAGIGCRFDAKQSFAAPFNWSHVFPTCKIDVRKARNYPTIRFMHPATPASIDDIATQLRDRTTGLVLAGGAGRRMQGRDKGLVSWQGEPLVAHAARSLRPLVSRLLISCNRNLDRYRNFGDSVVTDSRSPCEGPLAGLEAASKDLTTPLLLVSPCDMPGVSEAVFARLRDTITTPATSADKGFDAVYLFSGGREHYLCLALRREALAGITDYLDSGRRSVKGWLSTLDTRGIHIDLPQDALCNINRIYTGD